MNARANYRYKHSQDGTNESTAKQFARAQSALCALSRYQIGMFHSDTSTARRQLPSDTAEHREQDTETECVNTCVQADEKS